MLVLSRGKDESIMIGDNIEIMVVDIRRHKTQLGIVAPRAVPVYRKEVYGRIRRDREIERKEHVSARSRHRDSIAVEV